MLLKRIPILGVPLGGNTLGTKFFKEGKFEKKKWRKKRRGLHIQICLFSFSLYVFLQFDGCNSFSRDVLVYFLRA